MVGRMPWRIPPSILKTSPTSQMTMKVIDRPSAEERRKFSMICGEKTTTQQAIEIEPQIPERAARSILADC